MHRANRVLHHVQPSAEAPTDEITLFGTKPTRLSHADTSAKLPRLNTAERLDVPKLCEVLQPEADTREFRSQIYAILSEPLFAARPGLTLERERALTTSRVQRLAEARLLRVEDLRDNPRRFFAFYETLAACDATTGAKLGIHYTLWGGSVLWLGNERHHQRYLKDTNDLRYIGAFAMSELAHGSNVQALETTATYLRETDEFEIHTPSDAAQKYMIGNAANDARFCTVFAQLMMDGACYGIHAFVVELRHSDGTLCKGIAIRDMGHKAGMNGMDNGRIWFTRVRVPREALLNRYGGVTSGGKYESDIADPAVRFFATVGALIIGRCLLACSVVAGSKLALTIALRYAHTRRQFGLLGQPETPLILYVTHQRRLLPLLAKTYALSFACSYLKDCYVSRTEADVQNLHALSAGLKAVSTWHMVDTAQAARECCGSQGYLSINRLGAIRADADATVSYEGDNTVLLQLVGRHLLGELRAKLKKRSLLTSGFKFVRHSVVDKLYETNPVAVRRCADVHVRDSLFHVRAFKFRKWTLLYRLANLLQTALVLKGADKSAENPKQVRKTRAAAAWNRHLDLVVRTARAHVELVVLQRAYVAVAQVANEDVQDVLQRLIALYALHSMENDVLFLREGYFSKGLSEAISEQIDAICGELVERGHVLSLIEAFDIPEALLLGCPLAGDWLQANSRTQQPPESR